MKPFTQTKLLWSTLVTVEVVLLSFLSTTSTTGDQLQSLSQNMTNITNEICNGNHMEKYVVAVLLIIVGIALILAGYKVIRLVIFLTAFTLAFSLSYILIDNYAKYWNISFWGKIGISIAIGLVLGSLLVFFIKKAPYVLGFAVGVIVTSIFMSTPLGPLLFDKGNWIPLVILALGGIAGAVVAHFLINYIYMLTSAAGGSIFVVYAIDCAWLTTNFVDIIPSIITTRSLHLNGPILPYVLLVLVVVLTISGFIIQCRMDFKNKSKRYTPI